MWKLVIVGLSKPQLLIIPSTDLFPSTKKNNLKHQQGAKLAPAFILLWKILALKKFSNFTHVEVLCRGVLFWHPPEGNRVNPYVSQESNITEKKEKGAIQMKIPMKNNKLKFSWIVFFSNSPEIVRNLKVSMIRLSFISSSSFFVGGWKRYLFLCKKIKQEVIVLNFGSSINPWIKG